MKKVLIIFMIGMAMSQLNAQTISDAVQFSTENITGTARYRAVGGAFGALGGDLSALNNNPAGSAVFSQSFVSLSLSSDGYDNQTHYGDGITTNSNSDLDFNQLGAVFVSNGAGNVRKFSFGFNYDRYNDFDNQFIASGISNNSISDYFLGYAQGTPLELLELQDGETLDELYQFLGENESFGAQQAFLGYQGYLIDPESSDLNNTSYTNAQNGNAFDQEYQYTSFGNNSKFAFNAAAQLGENFYLGANLNIHAFNLTRNTLLFEDNNQGANAVNSLEFENQYRSIGSGISAQVGAIYKASQSLRLGLSLDSPTYYTISEETEQYLRTSGENGEVVINPNVINIYQDYEFQTPAKATGSIAYVFGAGGFLSFDYSYQDYSTIKFRPESDVFFNQLNADISSSLKSVSTYRLGGEFLAGNWSFRGGYRYQESPYVNESTLGDLTGYAVGLGYTIGNARIDVAYDWAKQEQNPALYDGAFTNTAFIDHINTSLVATLSFKL
ncbi:OmpP1/FadL family transporter [Leeuwenhoekiella nanhaiensis]|uniref:Transporter n=1 Tax=Leeuwenhoekiella nanhaiensis TaxID=1655491 RepID=A0A2G1VS22_9FLAO|nr:transporter [Leeuwenhoekiella nanhaiensis]PHQ29544.1 transporter [Leeuwenhoekiella nanhaiensis]